MNSRVTFTVAPGGTLSDYKTSTGARLVALEFSAVATADISLRFCGNGAGTGAKQIMHLSNAGVFEVWEVGAAAAMASGGVIPVPPEIAPLIGAGFMAVEFSAAQAPGVSITGHCQRDI